MGSEGGGGRGGVGAGWKRAGGLADLGEELAETASREVWEETGVRADFQGVVGFRHQHNTVFGVSDLYFVCKMTPREAGRAAASQLLQELAGLPGTTHLRENRRECLANLRSCRTPGSVQECREARQRTLYVPGHHALSQAQSGGARIRLECARAGGVDLRKSLGSDLRNC